MGIIGVVLLILARKTGKTESQQSSSAASIIIKTTNQEYKCDMCGQLVDKVTYSKIADDMGVRYRNLCDSCAEIYIPTSEE